MNKVNDFMAKVLVATGNAASAVVMPSGGGAPPSHPSLYARHTGVFSRLVDQLRVERSPSFRNDVLLRLDAWVTTEPTFEPPISAVMRSDLLKLWDTLLYLVEDKYCTRPRRCSVLRRSRGD